MLSAGVPQDILCVPDVSIESEVLHIHLLLHHLVLSFVDFLMLAILAGVR